MGYHAFALQRIEPEHEHLAGRRVVLLALAQRRGFAVPPGFVVLRKAFNDLVRDTQLKLLFPPLERRLIARAAPMEALSAEVGALIKGVAVPRHIMLDVESGCQAIGLGNRALGKAVTLRACPVDEHLSSAPLERAVAVTRLSEVEARLKACWASAFDPTNLEAVRHYGMSFAQAAPSVLVTETVPAEVSGLLFSHAPGDTGSFLIEAVWGFHEALTEAKFAPSRYFVARDGPGQVKATEAEQSWEYAQGPQGAMARRQVPADRATRPKLSRLQQDELIRAALELEVLVGGPIAFEWAIQGGVIFVVQVAPLVVGPLPPSEAESAERYIASLAAAEAAAATIRPRAPPAARPPEARPRASPAVPLGPAPPPPMPSTPSARPQPPPAPASSTNERRLLPVIRSTLLIELPKGARALDAAHIPHAGLVVDLSNWGDGDAADLLAAAARAIFPRPLLVELRDLAPADYEAMREATFGREAFQAADLRAVLGPTMDELALIARAAGEAGATNLHVIAPHIKSSHDTKVLRSALEAAGLSREGAPRTMLFSELRNPSTLLYNVDFADHQDGIIVRASRFYKALMREGDGAGQAVDGEARGSIDIGAHRSESFVHALFQVTRAFERAGGTVLVLLEGEDDFGTIWFYRELGVDGFIAKLEDAEATTRLLFDLEMRQPGVRKPGGKTA